MINYLFIKNIIIIIIDEEYFYFIIVFTHLLLNF